jgi:HsdM N-terminal domain
MRRMLDTSGMEREHARLAPKWFRRRGALFVVGGPQHLRTLDEMLLALAFACGALGFISALFGQVIVQWRFQKPAEQRASAFSLLRGVAIIQINVFLPAVLLQIGIASAGVIKGLGPGSSVHRAPDRQTGAAAARPALSEYAMTLQSATIVQRLWNYCNVLRDNGMSYGDYIEQLTYLLFLKMADEQVRVLGNRSAIPDDYHWQSLLRLDNLTRTHYAISHSAERHGHRTRSTSRKSAGG